MDIPSSLHSYRIALGQIGRYDNEKGREITAALAAMIPLFEAHIEKGNFKPLDYEVAEGKGWEAVIKAVATFEAGKVKNKLVVRIQDE